ncbi:LLM class flavin-dependent oxidoreductase [Phycicoccus sp. BSK3Z-2]|uniref:LLM class flavin-dependent oxidoreductase n=1 Tax=Phycicoccus avicenniae TaxID=2828860 RepID=A0A941I0Y9_9MICO|nr:LLM class flavin-dependent oxidoreductase [Phycicoccus avicenniae]MBR7743736.1 LLM class flavin-dependent oxidoreductase [Phycicoccus avicenniae]
MRFGAVLPFVSEKQFVDLARIAEDSGWDMVLTWEAVWAQDAWATLAAAATVTERIRLGTLITPVSRYRPWDLASRVGSVDRLSDGRVTLGVGLGALHDNWLAFEPDEGRGVRAAKVDEGLAVYAGLLGGGPFEFSGEHWTARPVEMLAPPPPVQRPHPPVWCVGALVPGVDRQRSLERAARWQGVLPAVVGGTVDDPGSRLTPSTLREVVDRIAALRAEAGHTMDGYDVVVEGDSHGDFGDVRPPVEPWREAGATWWVESWWDLPDSDEGRTELRRRLELGPQR